MDKELKQAFKACRTFGEVVPLLQRLPDEPEPVDVEFCSRVLGRFEYGTGPRIAYLGNHTVEPLPRYTAVACARRGFLPRQYLGQYNQHYQEVLDQDSDLHAFGPDIIFLSVGLRGLSPGIHSRFLELTAGERRTEMDRILGHIEQWISSARSHTDAVLLVANFPRPMYPQAGIADTRLELGEAEFYSELNLALQRLAPGDPRVFILDQDQVLARCGRLTAHDPRMYFLAKMEWAAPCLPHLAEELRRYIRGIRGDVRKCLVLDLDNTVWGGVVGEDGVDGVRIGPGDPEGEAFLEFQNAVRALKERGVILAICSKNNYEDAVEVFEKRTDMPLRIDDFAAVRINWRHKHENLQEIASLLNIGADSLVFMDDNPVECELIRQMMPEVCTIRLPDDPAAYAPLLRRIDEFENPDLTQEDRQKNEQYRQNAQREESRRTVGDLTGFLEGLGTRAVVHTARPEHSARIHQLFSKTNQFNMTTKRYGQGEIEEFISSEEWSLSLVEVTDNFGSLGIVGLFLIRLVNEEALVDSLILSCRAMGRGIETAMMNAIKKDWLLSGRCGAIEALYYPTKKNRPASGFYEKQGFSVVEEYGEGGRRYRLERDSADLLDCPGITMETGT